jgi:hypothetical protein
MRKYLNIYEEAVSHIGLCNCSILNFLTYEENLIYFFISAVQDQLLHRIVYNDKQIIFWLSGNYQLWPSVQTMYMQHPGLNSCILQPEFYNLKGAQESIPRNQFRKPM